MFDNTVCRVPHVVDRPVEDGADGDAEDVPVVPPGLIGHWLEDRSGMLGPRDPVGGFGVTDSRSCTSDSVRSRVATSGSVSPSTITLVGPRLQVVARPSRARRRESGCPRTSSTRCRRARWRTPLHTEPDIFSTAPGVPHVELAARRRSQRHRPHRCRPTHRRPLGSAPDWRGPWSTCTPSVRSGVTDAQRVFLVFPDHP